MSIDLTANVTLEESVLLDNIAFLQGGAVSMTRKTTLLMTRTTLTRNVVKGVTSSKNIFSPGMGGAVWIGGVGTSLRVQQSSHFYYNKASKGFGGSIACEDGAKLEVMNTDFMGYKTFNATIADKQDMMEQPVSDSLTVVATDDSTGNKDGGEDGGEGSSIVEITDTNGLAAEGGGIFISGLKTSATFVELTFTNMNADN